MNTQEIFAAALEAAGLSEAPDDSGVLVPGENIKKVAFGVDIDTAEIILAREIGVDCVITHHPQGQNRVDLHKVMDNQVDRMVKAGIPLNKAEKMLEKRIGQVKRGLHVSNYDRGVRSAELLGMPFMGIHTPADVMVENFIQGKMDALYEKDPSMKVSDIIECLKGIAEYRKSKAEPQVWVGTGKSYAGRPFVTMAGGTGGGPDAAKAYFDAGVGTLVEMHASEDVIKAVKEQNIGNIVVAGHMASDSIGINLVIGALEAKGLEVIRISGVIDPCAE